MENEAGFHLYTVHFMYRGKCYSNTFQSTAKITPTTDPLVAWGLVDDSIKQELMKIIDRKKGVYPYSIYVEGEFGSLTIKE